VRRTARKATAEAAEFAEFSGEMHDSIVGLAIASTVRMTDPAGRMELNAFTDHIIGAAVAVHRALGPGLLESAYEACFGYELRKRGLRVEQQKPLPVEYENVKVECGYRLDFVVNDEVIIEVKSVKRIKDVHVAQLLSYLRLMNKRVGLLINFNVKWLVQDGIRRVVNRFPD
jgi:GxxExxY protein